MQKFFHIRLNKERVERPYSNKSFEEIYSSITNLILFYETLIDILSVFNINNNDDNGIPELVDDENFIYCKS